MFFAWKIVKLKIMAALLYLLANQYSQYRPFFFNWAGLALDDILALLFMTPIFRPIAGVG